MKPLPTLKNKITFFTLIFTVKNQYGQNLYFCSITFSVFILIYLIIHSFFQYSTDEKYFSRQNYLVIIIINNVKGFPLYHSLLFLYCYHSSLPLNQIYHSEECAIFFNYNNSLK